MLRSRLLEYLLRLAKTFMLGSLGAQLAQPYPTFLGELNPLDRVSATPRQSIARTLGLRQWVFIANPKYSQTILGIRQANRIEN